MVKTLFSGPYRWIVAKDFQEVRRELGMHGEIKSVDDVSLAARLRVLHREARASGGIQAHALVRRIDSASRASDAMATAAWSTWMSQSFAHHLVAAERELAAKGITAAALARRHQGQPALDAGLQRAAHRALRDFAAPHWERRLRQRLDHFKVSVLPGRRPARAVATMRALVKIVQGWIDNGYVEHVTDHHVEWFSQALAVPKKSETFPWRGVVDMRGPNSQTRACNYPFIAVRKFW